MNEFQEWGMVSGAIIGTKIALTTVLNAYKINSMIMIRDD